MLERQQLKSYSKQDGDELHVLLKLPFGADPSGWDYTLVFPFMLQTCVLCCM